MSVPTPPSLPRSGILCVVSGPSGCGKTTLCRAASTIEGTAYTVSATTRPARPGEVDGVDYHFLSEGEFHERVQRGEFLEWATVYGRHYGTLRSEVVPRLERGEDVLMDLDTQGAAMLRDISEPLIRAAHFDVFILPPTLDELRRRLAGRHSDSPDAQERRFASAMAEMKHWQSYTYALLSDSRENDLARFRQLLAAERLKTHRMTGLAFPI